MTRPEISIVGGGPAGLEAALYARACGWPATVFEAGEQPGANVARWGFVRLLTPWRMNVSPLGLRVLRERGLPAPDPEQSPTGRELVAHYLQPIAESLGESFRPRSRVVGISRQCLLKHENIGGRRRAAAPLRLLLDTDSGERATNAAVVIDASGVYDNPNPLGDGGMSAPGERRLGSRIRYHLADIDGTERDDFAGRSTLLVGAGFSAATSLTQLLRVRADDPSTSILWSRRSTGPAPFPIYDNDPLPERATLAAQGNAIAREPPPGVEIYSGVAIDAIEETAGRLAVAFCPVDGGGAPERVEVDTILANVGYRPDLSLARELQVHLCYATEGPMALATHLRKSSGTGAGSDCLAWASAAADLLRNPEPGFFVLGHKSYGRRSDYLMRVGREQVRDIFRLLENDPELDVYGSSETHTKP